jgi:hypothetical protein
MLNSTLLRDSPAPGSAVCPWLPLLGGEETWLFFRWLRFGRFSEVFGPRGSFCSSIHPPPIDLAPVTPHWPLFAAGVLISLCPQRWIYPRQMRYRLIRPIRPL